jgi:hypothetical protein
VKRRRFFSASVAALVAIGAAPAWAQSLPPGVDDCVALVKERNPDANVDAAGAEAPLLGDVCPELAAAINEGPWGEAIAEVWADELSLNAFLELTQLVSVYDRPAAGDFALHSEALDESLAALTLEKPTAELTLWARIQRWFDEQFGSRGADARGWFEKWLEHLSPSERVVRYLVVVLGIVLVVATVIVVVNELRVAGVLAGDVLRKYSPLAPSSPERGDARALDLDDIARAPLARRPVLLLALVLERLRARGGVPLRDSLTHRELLGAAAGLSAEQNAAFAAVVGAAERVTFGEWRPEERDVEGLVARGRALLASFAGPEGATR